MEARQQDRSTAGAAAAGIEHALKRLDLVARNVDEASGGTRARRLWSAISVRARAETGFVPFQVVDRKQRPHVLALAGRNARLHNVASTAGCEPAWRANFRKLTGPRALRTIERAQSSFEANTADIEGNGRPAPREQAIFWDSHGLLRLPFGKARRPSHNTAAERAPESRGAFGVAASSAPRTPEKKIPSGEHVFYSRLESGIVAGEPKRVGWLR